MMWQLAHARGSFVRYEYPFAYTKVNEPMPRTRPTKAAATAIARLRVIRSQLCYREPPPSVRMLAVRGVDVADIDCAHQADFGMVEDVAMVHPRPSAVE